MLVEMAAAQGGEGEGADSVYKGIQKIDIKHFYECLRDTD